MKDETPELWRYQLAVVVLLAVLLAAVVILAPRNRVSPRYAVTHIGNSNAIMADSDTGKSWLLEIDGSDKTYWAPLSKSGD